MNPQTKSKLVLVLRVASALLLSTAAWSGFGLVLFALKTNIFIAVPVFCMVFAVLALNLVPRLTDRIGDWDLYVTYGGLPIALLLGAAWAFGWFGLMVGLLHLAGGALLQSVILRYMPSK